MNIAANDSAALAGKIVKNALGTNQIAGFGGFRPLASLEGVYMRKLSPARLSYQDDFLISYRVYMMTGPFRISLFEGTLHVVKIHV